MKIVLLPAAAWLAATLSAAAAPVQPPQPAASAVDPAHCTWEWKFDAGFGAWTERCDLQTGVWALAFRDDPARYVLTIDGKDNGVVLQPFSKMSDADPTVIVLELRLRGYIPDDDECVLEPARPELTAQFAAGPSTRTYFEIVPTGKRKEAYDATPADEVPEPQCGEYGSGPEGVRLFMADSAFPDRLIYMNLGEDGTMFDPTTVTLE